MRTESETELRRVLENVIKAEDERQKEFWRINEQITGRPSIVALSVADFPPQIRGNPDKCLYHLLVERMGVVKPSEFETISLTEMESRGIAGNGLLESVDEIKKNMLRRGDLKEGKKYKVVKQRGSDGRKPLKKEIAERLGLSRPALDDLLKNPDNEWGLKTDCTQSWQAFDYYCETHKDIIDKHKANPKCKIRKSRAKLVLTKKGDMSGLSQSATQNFKPHGRTIAKPKR